jgi:hypothetical protein
MIDRDGVVPVLRGFFLHKKRQKVLVWVLPQHSLVHGGSKDWPWCLIQ